MARASDNGTVPASDNDTVPLSNNAEARLSDDTEAAGRRPTAARAPLSDNGSKEHSDTEEAAAFLGPLVRVLRDALTEHARLVGGFPEARFDGIIARRIGRRWKVWLSELWTAPEMAGAEPRRPATLNPTESAGHGGKESPHGGA